MSTLSFNQLAKNCIGDFFHIPSNYDLRIAKYTNLHLRDQEGVKTRQIYGNLCSIANGIAFSIPSHGTSLVVVVFAARRLYVANYKLQLIRKELLDRSLTLRPFLKRDWMIPVVVQLTAASITWGVDLGLSQLIPVNQLTSLPMGSPDNLLGGIPTDHIQHAATHAATHAGTGQLNLVAHHTGAAGTGFVQGVHNQISTLFGDGFQSTTAITGNVNDPNFIAEQWGLLQGAAAAQMAEQSITSQMGAMAMQFTTDKLDFESLKRRNPLALGCRRLPWSTRVVCQECVMPIESGLFFHTCGVSEFADEDDDLDDNEYDVCWSCYNGLKNDQFKAQLRAMYFAVPGDSFHPGLNAVTLVDLLGPKILLCMACNCNITNGWYYDCWDCREGDKRWTFCQTCYREGGSCTRNRAHRLFAFSRSRIANYDSKTPYQTKGPKGAKETGRASCTNCHANIERGAYFHCAKCENGDYILCVKCHASERHCLNSSHVLTKYYAWKYRREYDTVSAAQWQCSNPDCLNVVDADREKDRFGGTGKAEEVVGDISSLLGDRKDKDKKKSRMSFITIKEKKVKKPPGVEMSKKRVKFKFFFSCRESVCHNREYGLCPACYFTDLTCPVKGHDMYKCFFVK